MNQHEEVSVEYIYEYWDCPNCGHKGIRGDVLTCAQCGTPRNKDIVFYRSKTQEQQVETSAEVERFEAGPDWKCSFCSTLSPAAESACRGCGHSRTESDQNYFDVLEQREQREAERKTHHTYGRMNPSKLPRWAKITCAAVGSVIVLGGVTWFWATRTHALTYQVADVHWERSIPVLRYQWVEREDWAEEMKGDDVHKLRQRPEIHHYEKRLVGSRTEFYADEERVPLGTHKECQTSYRSSGNGAGKKTTTCRDVPQFTTRTVRRSREVPIYRDFPVSALKVRYKAKLYSTLKTEKLEGANNSPAWPVVQLGTGENGKPDKEGDRGEKYVVTMKIVKPQDSAPAAFELTPPADEFAKIYLLGRKLNFQVSNTGVVAPLSPKTQIKLSSANQKGEKKP